MAIKIEQLISSILLLVCVCVHLPLSAADPFTTTVWTNCGITEYRNGSAFQLNLNQVLESLVQNVYPSRFNESSVVDEGQNSNSTVYGRVQCRGDLNSSDCEQCASTAKTRLVEVCLNNTSGFIQLDGCVLRYDNQNFYNNYSYNGTVPNVICNGAIQLQFSNAIKSMLLQISSNASESSELFASNSAPAPDNSTKYIYNLAQCWRDQSQTDCGSCLSTALTTLQKCSTGAIGSQFGSMQCYLRSEVYEFFNPSILSPSPPPPTEGKGSKVLGITLGAVAATVGLIAAIGFCKWKFFSRQNRHWGRISRTKDDEGEINLPPIISNSELILKYDILKKATSNFKAENKLGEGGFGSVYKGVLPDCTEVAVKRLKLGSSQGDDEFLNEANLICRVQHKNLVKLLGCSVENSERLLVYEFLQNSSLDRIIFDTTKRHLLDWRDRYEIIVGTARGLAYLHEESEIRIIHRDIKASNILLDNKYRPKIADFGLAKLFGEDESHVSTRIAGTIGYMAPEYALRGQLTEKADVFSFGVLVLEIISGRKNQTLHQDMYQFLIEGTWRLYKAERALEIMDPTLEGSCSREEGIRVIKIGLLCTQSAAALRPSMSLVVSMLTSGQEHDLPSPTRPAFIDLDGVGNPDQVKSGSVFETDKTSSSVATSSTTPSYIHSAAADTSSGILETR